MNNPHFGAWGAALALALLAGLFVSACASGDDDDAASEDDTASAGDDDAVPDVGTDDDDDAAAQDDDDADDDTSDDDATGDDTADDDTADDDRTDDDAVADDDEVADDDDVADDDEVADDDDVADDDEIADDDAVADDDDVADDDAVADDDDDEAPPDDAARALASGPDSDNTPDPAAMGPYPVGVRTDHYVYTYVHGMSGDERDLPVEIWYPADDAAIGMPTEVFDLRALIPEEFQEDLLDTEIPPIPTDTVRDAPLRRLGEKFPVVFFSHGNGGIRQQSVFFTQVLASHGFIVVAPDHVGNTAIDLLLADSTDEIIGETAGSAPKRQRDIKEMTDWMTLRNRDENDFFYQAVGTTHYGVSGHSFGGWTTVASAEDKRIKAVAPMAPPVGPYSGALMTDYPAPIMLHGATTDQTVSYEQQDILYDKLNADRYFVSLIDGGHFSYSDLCRLDLATVAEVLGLDAGDYLRDGCGEENVPYVDAQKAINYFTIAFFSYYLRESRAMYDAYLTPEKAAAIKEMIFESDVVLPVF